MLGISEMKEQVFKLASIGSLIPKSNFTGKIFSIHSRVINILHPENYLLSIIADLYNMTDYSILCPALFNRELYFKSGDKVEFIVNKSLVIGSNRIELSNTKIWSGEIDNVIVYDLFAKCIKLRENYLKFAPEEGFSSIIRSNPNDIYSKKAISILDKIDLESVSSLKTLIGLGIGFTPSGDDFITGVLLAEKIILNICEDLPYSNWHKGIKTNLFKTTSGGMTLLELALKNSYPFYLRKMANDLTYMKIEHKKYRGDIITNVLNHGETSGSDTLSGFFWFLTLIAKNMELFSAYNRLLP